MKRIYIALALSLSLAASLFGGPGRERAVDNGKINVVTTIFPPYDFVRAIAGDRVNLTMLLPPAAESHSFEPTPQDIIRVRNSALFIYIGGESDAWVDYILDSMPTESMRILPLMDKVDVVEELVVEGMQDEEEGHDHGHNSSIFEDRDIRDRPTLGDWEGEWQSGYPYVVNGALEEVFEHKAEDDDSKTAAEYKQYYLTGYRTNYDRLVIRGDRITWYTGQRNVTVQYRYRGYAILDYGDGERGVRYQFEAAGPTNGAPRYLQFSDHNIGPTADLHHFHVYYGDDGFEPMLENLVNWPTYYPADWGAAEIAADMIGHDHGEGEAELDEHIWTSPRNAITLVEAITEALSEADPANAEFFRQNAAAYTAQLRALDAAFREVVNQASRRTIILGDRFPFRYFADAYGLSYFAAFPGCSTETEASAATIAFLINKVRDERIPVVFHIELSNERITDTICEATGARKLLLHSAHNITKRDFERGVTYLELQQANVGRLREALR